MSAYSDETLKLITTALAANTRDGLRIRAIVQLLGADFSRALLHRAQHKTNDSDIARASFFQLAKREIPRNLWVRDVGDDSTEPQSRDSLPSAPGQLGYRTTVRQKSDPVADPDKDLPVFEQRPPERRKRSRSKGEQPLPPRREKEARFDPELETALWSIVMAPKRKRK